MAFIGKNIFYQNITGNDPNEVNILLKKCTILASEEPINGNGTAVVIIEQNVIKSQRSLFDVICIVIVCMDWVHLDGLLVVIESR